MKMRSYADIDGIESDSASFSSSNELWNPEKEEGESLFVIAASATLLSSFIHLETKRVN